MSSTNLLTASAKYLQSLLDTKAKTNVDLVNLYLAQIKRHDAYLLAMLR